MQQIAAVEQEFCAAQSASELFQDETRSNPSYGESRGWNPQAGAAFVENLETTYLIRIYAEFEAGLRDYWRTHHRRKSYPKMEQLVRHAIPDQAFSQDIIDAADRVREYRNILVHGDEDDPPDQILRLTVPDAKKFLCTYFSRLAPW